MSRILQQSYRCAVAALRRQGHTQVRPHVNTQRNFPSQGAWRNAPLAAHIRSLAYWMYCWGFCLFCFTWKRKRKPSQLFLGSPSAAREDPWAAIDLIPWQTAVSPRLHSPAQHVRGNQWGMRCHNSAIKRWFCLSDNCLAAKWQARFNYYIYSYWCGVCFQCSVSC